MTSTFPTRHRSYRLGVWDEVRYGASQLHLMTGRTFFPGSTMKQFLRFQIDTKSLIQVLAPFFLVYSWFILKSNGFKLNPRCNIYCPYSLEQCNFTESYFFPSNKQNWSIRNFQGGVIILWYEGVPTTISACNK